MSKSKMKTIVGALMMCVIGATQGCAIVDPKEAGVVTAAIEELTPDEAAALNNAGRGWKLMGRLGALSDEQKNLVLWKRKCTQDNGKTFEQRVTVYDLYGHLLEGAWRTIDTVWGIFLDQNFSRVPAGTAGCGEWEQQPGDDVAAVIAKLEDIEHAQLVDAEADAAEAAEQRVKAFVAEHGEQILWTGAAGAAFAAALFTTKNVPLSFEAAAYFTSMCGLGKTDFCGSDGAGEGIEPMLLPTPDEINDNPPMPH